MAMAAMVAVAWVSVAWVSVAWEAVMDLKTAGQSPFSARHPDARDDPSGATQELVSPGNTIKSM